MASYDDTGKVAESAWVLEKGSYCFYVGNSVRDVERIEFFEYEVEQDTVTEQLSRQLEPKKLTRRMLADGSWKGLRLRFVVLTGIAGRGRKAGFF